MPNNPDVLHAIVELIAKWWPQIYGWLLSFVIGLVRALLNGGKLTHSLLEALLCGCLTLGVFPVLDYFGMNTYLAVAIGSAIAFLGVDWFREFLSAYLGRWSNRE
ncbi:hypothetical protein LMG33818_002626 [Halomonadaceae bacterium LMG 33818]|uniref:phage holin, lambda family n=1 Tax=Cernens ardua TaxID=3402176 RepID=UPI003EDBE8D4